MYEFSSSYETSSGYIYIPVILSILTDNNYICITFCISKKYDNLDIY